MWGPATSPLILKGRWWGNMASRFFKSLIMAVAGTAAVACAAFGLHHLASPPFPEVVLKGVEAEKLNYASSARTSWEVDQTTVQLHLRLQEPGEGFSAGLIMHGVETHSAFFEGGVLTFDPISISAATTTIDLEMRRHLGPLILRKRKELEFVPIATADRTEGILPPLVSRKLAIELDPEHLRWTTTAKLQSGDPRLAALTAGALSREVFLNDLNGFFAFNNRVFGAGDLKDLTIRTHHDQVWIVAHYEVSRERVPSEDRLTVYRIIEPHSDAEQDLVEISVKDLRLNGFAPPPKRVVNGTILWTRAELEEDAVTVFIEPHTETPVIRHLSPQDLFPGWAAGLLYKLIGLIPVFWLLHLVRKRVFGPSSRFSGLETDTLSLGVIGLFASINFLVLNLARQLGGLAGRWDVASDFLPVVVIPLSVLVLWLGSRSVLAVAVKLSPRKVLTDLFRDFHRLVSRTLVWGLPVQALAVATQISQNLVFPTTFAMSYAGLLFAWILCAGVFMCLIFQGEHQLRALLNLPRRTTLVVCLLVLAALVICYPYTAQWMPLDRQFWHQPWRGVFSLLSFLGKLGSIVPLLAMILVCIVLYALGGLRDSTQSKQVARLLFAGVLVGTGSVWFVFPVPLLLALVLFPLLVWNDGNRIQILSANRSVIYQDRAVLLDRACQHAKTQWSGGGWFGFGLLGLKEDEKKKLNDNKKLRVKLPSGEKMPASDLVFAFGPHSWASDNALQALRTGVWGALIFVVIYAFPSFIEQPRAGEDFPYLWALVRVVSVAGYWLLGAFFLGYFYEMIRGKTGWQKGATLAAAISLAIEPMAFVLAQSTVEYSAIVVSVIQRFAFFILVGLLAFDVSTFRLFKTAKTSWHRFPQLSGLSVMQASFSVALAGLGVTLSGAFTGQITTVLAQVAAALIPTINTVQPLTQ